MIDQIAMLTLLCVALALVSGKQMFQGDQKDKHGTFAVFSLSGICALLLVSRQLTELMALGFYGQYITTVLVICAFLVFAAELEVQSFFRRYCRRHFES